MSWKSVCNNRLDDKRLKEEQPDIYEKYKRIIVLYGSVARNESTEEIVDKELSVIIKNSSFLREKSDYDIIFITEKDFYGEGCPCQLLLGCF